MGIKNNEDGMGRGTGEGRVTGGRSPVAPANDSFHEKGGNICRLIQNFCKEEQCEVWRQLYIYSLQASIPLWYIFFLSFQFILSL